MSEHGPTRPPAAQGLKSILADNWAELTLLPGGLVAAVIYQGGIFFWLGISLLCLLGWLIVRSIRLAAPPVLPLGPLPLAIAAFWLWCAATITWSVVPLASLNATLALVVLPLGLVIYALALHGDRRRVAIAFGVIVLVGLGLAMMSFNEARLGIVYPRSLFLNKNSHAGFLSLIILPAAAGFVLARRRGLALVLGISLAALAFSAGLPASRGALIGLAVGGMVFLAVGWRGGRRQRLMAAVAIVVVGYALAGSESDLGSRLEALPSETVASGERWYIWEGALSLWAATPWYGQGVGTFWFTYQAYRHPVDSSAGSNAHNDYLQLLIETGVPGVALLLAVIVAVSWKGRSVLSDRSRTSDERLEAAALIGSLAAVVAHSLVSMNLYQPAFLLLMGLYLGRLQELAGSDRRAWALIPRSRYAIAAGFGVGAILISGITLSSAIVVRASEAINAGDPDRAASLLARLPEWHPYDDRIPYLEASVALALIERNGSRAPEYDVTSYENILDRLAKAERVNPLRPSIPDLRARARLTLGSESETEAALRDFRRALAVQPRFFQARLRYAETLLKLGRVREAHAVLVDGLKFAYSPYDGLPEYFLLTEALCLEVGDEQNAERAQAGLQRHERRLEQLRAQRGRWGLNQP